MIHVFVETNWLVDFAAPSYRRTPAVVELYGRAKTGELQIHIPAICISEARRPVHERFQIRKEADSVREYLSWAKLQGRLTADEDEVTRRVLDQMEAHVRYELARFDSKIADLKHDIAVDIFALDEEMLQLCTELSYEKLGLQPFDQAILAAVLVRARQLSAVDVPAEFAFCELDTDLQPWDKNGAAKQPLTQLYDDAGVWVYGEFLLSQPERPPNWPGEDHS